MNEKIVKTMKTHLQGLSDLGVITINEVNDAIQFISQANKEQNSHLKLLNKKEVAALLSCSTKTIERFVADGIITPIYLREGNIVETTAGKRRLGANVKFRLKDIESLITEQQNGK